MVVLKRLLVGALGASRAEDRTEFEHLAGGFPDQFVRSV